MNRYTAYADPYLQQPDPLAGYDPYAQDTLDSSDPNLSAYDPETDPNSPDFNPDLYDVVTAGDGPADWNTVLGAEPGGEDTGATPADGEDTFDLGAVLGAGRRGRGRTPRRPTTVDALDAIGLNTIGKSYGGMTPAERSAAVRALGQADSAAFSAYGKGFRDIDKDKQAQIAATLDFSVKPEDDPAHRRDLAQARADARRADAIARSDRQRAEHLALFGAHRGEAWARSDRLRAEAIARSDTLRMGSQARADALRRELWGRQDRLRADALAQQQNEKFGAAAIRQPAPLRASGGASGGAAPSVSWPMLINAIPPDDLRNLTSAWMGGSVGTGALAPARLQRLMALLPVANNATDFVTGLRRAWLAAGAPDAPVPTSQQTIRVPALSVPPLRQPHVIRRNRR